MIGGILSKRDYFAIHSGQPSRTAIVEAAGATYSVVSGEVTVDKSLPPVDFEEWVDAVGAERRRHFEAKARYAAADALIAAGETS